jgi:hypothetical protein
MTATTPVDAAVLAECDGSRPTDLLRACGLHVRDEILQREEVRPL